MTRILRGINGRLIETSCSELDDGSHLVPVQPVKPFHDVVDVGSGFEILKNGGYGHSSAFQHPRATDLTGMALDAGPFRPINTCHSRALLLYYARRVDMEPLRPCTLSARGGWVQ